MTPERKLTQFQESVCTAEMYWAVVLPEYRTPESRWFVGWLRRVSLENLMTILDEMSKRNLRRRFDNGNHLGRCVSGAVRDLSDGVPDGDRCRAVYFD